MELVCEHTSVPVPNPLGSEFRPGYGEIRMPLIPGVSLTEVWRDLGAEAKTSICTQIWKFVQEWRCIPKPLHLQHLYQCSVDGKFGYNPLIYRHDSPPPLDMASNIVSDEALRERICQNYANYSEAWGCELTKAQLAEMLPRCDKPSVFTHGDLQPKNVMVSGSQVTGILDWETAGWYPEWWEHLCCNIPAYVSGDWTEFMMACAPETWDLTGVFAACKYLNS